MPKATVTIDLPDGWELADTKMRKAKPGEYRWLPAVGKPYRLESASEGECFIVRRIADQYVNVRLRREAAAHFATLGKFDNPESYHDHLVNACKEAVRERCPGYYHANPELTGHCKRGFDYDYYAHKDGTEDFPCTRDPGHAGEHGV